MQKIVAILDHLVVERIEESLIHRFRIPERGHVLVHLPELLREIVLFRLLQPSEHDLLEARHPAIESPEFFQDLGELFAVLVLAPGLVRQSLLRFSAQLLGS
jgi:hypothetical protein